MACRLGFKWWQWCNQRGSWPGRNTTLFCEKEQHCWRWTIQQLEMIFDWCGCTLPGLPKLQHCTEAGGIFVLSDNGHYMFTQVLGSKSMPGNIHFWKCRTPWSVLFAWQSIENCHHLMQLWISNSSSFEFCLTFEGFWIIHSLSPYRCSPICWCSLLAQNAAKMIKEAMDKKFGMAWHVVVGEGYAFEISHESKNVLHMYFGGQISTLVWKCS